MLPRGVSHLYVICSSTLIAYILISNFIIQNYWIFLGHEVIMSRQDVICYTAANFAMIEKSGDVIVMCNKAADKKQEYHVISTSISYCRYI